MKKMTLIALLLALSLVFCGCAAAEQAADTAADAVEEVVIEIEETDAQEDALLATAYNGELSVYASEVKENFDAMLPQYVAYYSQYGYAVDEYDVELQNAAAQEIVQIAMTEKIVNRRAQELGYTLTAEKDEEIKASIQMAIDSMREYYESYLAHYGYSGEELAKIVDEEMAALGYDFDALYEGGKMNAKVDFLYELATKDVTITDDEVKAAFDAKVEEQKTAYADADAFVTAYLGGEDILYTPEGMRVMHCIYIAKEAEGVEAAETTETDPAALTGLAKAEDVLAKISAGEDFTAAMNTYNEDASTAEQMETGYPVSEGVMTYGDEFKAAAMALENVGDVSDVVVTEYGYFILKYAKDLTAGAVEFEPRKAQETEEALAAKQSQVFSEYTNKMIADAGVVINDLSPLFNIFVAETVEAQIAYLTVTEETALCDMPQGDAVATLAAGATLDMLGRIGVDGEEYVFVAVPGTAFKGYVNVKATANMEPDDALAVDNTALATAAAALDKLPTFTIAMNDGSVIYGELYPDVTPESVGNFAALANSGFYNGLTFHRVIPGFMIQGGDPNGDGTGGPGYAIRGEFKNNGVENALSHTRGVLSMARSSAMDSAGSQFFIMHADNDYLDGDYAAFGLVLGGIESVDLIASVPTGSNDKPMTEQIMREVYVETYGQTYEFSKLED